jgi:hypothetical protein
MGKKLLIERIYVLLPLLLAPRSSWPALSRNKVCHIHRRSQIFSTGVNTLIIGLNMNFQGWQG